MKHTFYLIKDISLNALSVLGSAWIVIKIADFFFTQYIGWLKEIPAFFVLVGFSIVCAIINKWPYKKIRERISGTDSYITLRYGDVLKSDGHIVISSSNYFNTSSDIIAPNSLLGQTIKKYYGGDNSKIEKDIASSLSITEGTETPAVRGKQISYPIGSVAVANIKDKKKAFLIAITKIKYVDGKEIIESNISNIHEALNRLWDKVDVEINDEILNITPFGSGIAKAFNRRVESILFIIQSFIDRAKKKRPCSELVIYVRKNEISLSEYMELKKIVKFLA